MSQALIRGTLRGVGGRGGYPLPPQRVLMNQALAFAAILRRQYSDYAVWQRAFLAAGEEQRCLDIWASELAGRATQKHMESDGE